MVDEGVAEGVHVHFPDGIHQGRGLHAAVLVALVHLDAGAGGDVAVSRAVDDGLGEDDFAAGLGFDDDAPDGIAVLDDIGAEDIHKHLYTNLFHHLKRDGLDLFRIDDRQAHVVLAGHVRAGGAAGGEPVDQFLCKALDALLAVDIQVGEDGQAEGQVAAEIAAAFQEHHLASVPGGRLGGHDAGRTAADDEDIHLGAYRKFPGGFVPGPHFSICLK